MALSTIVKLTCGTCGKVAVEKSRFNLGKKKVISLECGHMIYEEGLSSFNIAGILNGTKLWPYQVEGVQFLEKANARALLADQQGLGKTVQVMALIKLHRNELTPCIVVAPTSVKLQWHHEFLARCGVEGFLTQVISSGKELAAPGFDIYVCTYDLLKNERTFDLVRDKIKLVVIDECQRIKDHLSGRAKAVQKICKNVEHILALSGTPIKNHAGEYFTVLNLIAPRLFPHYMSFIERECDSYHNGWGMKVGGLRNPEAFKEKTKDFIIRRVKDDVLKDLPQKTRKFFHCELDKRLNKAYADALTELEELYYSDEGSAFDRQSNQLAIMTKMRQITGIGKVKHAVEFATEFVQSCDRKLTIFAHHHVAVDMLIAELNSELAKIGEKPVLNLHSGLDSFKRQEIVDKFKDNGSRIMVASQLAAGEGINLQFCSDAIMLERQWNPANEEQSEDRFHRFGQTWPVSITYMIASETIDEYFTELVETKRAIVAGALDHKEVAWDQPSLMTELASILVTKGKKAWSLK